MDPEIIRLLKERNLPIFGNPFDANLVVIRDSKGKIDTFDGTLNLVWREQVNGPWHLLSCPVATRPGSYYLNHPMNQNGTATLQPGRHTLSHALGLHKGVSPAFVQVGKVVVKRDNDKDAVLDPNDELWNDASGINIHYISDCRFLAGCQGVPSQAYLYEFLEAFKKLQIKRPQPSVSLTLIEV